MDTQRQEARRDLEDRYEVRMAGEGGQGMILAGVILAEAAAIHDGLNAVQTQSYGPEARGGASRSEVVIARGEIEGRRLDPRRLQQGEPDAEPPRAAGAYHPDRRG